MIDLEAIKARVLRAVIAGHAMPGVCLVGGADLAALVAEVGEPKANLSWVTDDKCMVVFDTGHAQKFLLASTEAEALVYALESAP